MLAYRVAVIRTNQIAALGYVSSINQIFCIRVCILPDQIGALGYISRTNQIAAMSYLSCTNLSQHISHQSERLRIVFWLMLSWNQGAFVRALSL